MNLITEQLYSAFLEDFNFYGTLTGNEKQTTTLYVDPSCKLAASDECFPFRHKMTEELFPKLFCSQSDHSACVNDKCKEYTKFKKTESHLFLILGGSGKGKTMCALNLANFYWEKIMKFKRKFPFRSNFKFSLKENDTTTVIPIYIYLPSVKGDWKNVLQTYFQAKGITSDSYNTINKRNNVLIILDGYDEIASSYISEPSGKLFILSILSIK